MGGYYYSLEIREHAKFKRVRKIRLPNDSPELHNLKQILLKSLQRARRLKYSKKYGPFNILKILDLIIPHEYFGCSRHRRLLYSIINRILTSSVHECIYKQHLVKGYNYSKITWLNKLEYSQEKCRRLVMQTNIWLLNNVVKPLIAANYYSIKTRKSHEIKLVPCHVWKRFQHRAFNYMMSMGYITFNENYKYNVKPRGALQILPKVDYQQYKKFRPLAILYKTKEVLRFKHICPKIYAAAREICFVQTGSLYSCWKKYTDTVGDKRIYGIKVDIKDAYGMINIVRLHNIIDSVNSGLTDRVKDNVKEYVTQQFVVFNKSPDKKPLIWQWKHGLLQGDKLSASLCELYLSYMDSMHLFEFNKPNCFLHRTVDDYFFCSTKESDVNNFFAKIKDVYEINITKTKNVGCIPYAGQVFNLETKCVSTLYKFKKGTRLNHRYKFWNRQAPIPYSDKHRFLARPMLYAYNNYRFKKMELNTHFNTENTVLQNFFNAMIHLAFKFDAVVMARYLNETVDVTVVEAVMQKTVYKFSQKAFQKLKELKGKYDNGTLNMQILIKIGYKAFILVLKKRSKIYLDLVLKTEKKLKLKFLYIPSDDIKKTYFCTLPQCFLHISTNRVYKS